MKVTQKQKQDDVITLSVVATDDDVSRALQLAQEAFANAMGLKPDGAKTVAQVAEEKLGIKDLDSIVADSASELLIPMALDKKNIIPAFMPKMEAEGKPLRGQEFKFTLEVTLKPKYELSSYDPVEIEVVPFSVSEEEVDAEIERSTGSFTAYVKDPDTDADRTVKDGDILKIALEAFQDGESIKPLKTDGRTYVVGAGYMPPKFDEEIAGMRAGEEREFDFPAPSLSAETPDKEDTIHAKVKVIEFQREEKPKVDDEWVKLNFPIFKSVEEMRTNVRKSLEIEARASYDSYLRQAVAVKLSERFEGKIPDEIYEAMMAQIRRNMQLDLQQQGKSWEDFVAENGGDQQLTMYLMLQAREVITQGFALDAIFRHFKLTVDSDDIDAVCKLMNPNGSPKFMREQAERAGQGFTLREMAERYKANQYALDNAKITYIED